MVNADVEGDRLSVRNARTCGIIYAVIAAADDKGRPYFWTLIARKKEMLGLLILSPFLRARCPGPF